MKKITLGIATLGLSWICSPVFAQNTAPDSLGLPGDNLNLYAVLDIFQKSSTLEEFEKSLNSQDNKINNLDLNNDGKTDYIRVIDNVKGTSHAIVLQDNISAKEAQDVAVIDVDRDKDDNVQIQIIGDELLYGKNYVVEPKQTLKSASGNTPNPGYSSNNGGSQVTNVTNNYYNNNNSNNNYNNGYSGYYNNGTYYTPYTNYWYPVSTWAIIRYMYYPTYSVYVSPWSWGYYPWYWNPWQPMFWHSYYYGWIHPHYNHCYGWYKSGSINNGPANAYYGHHKTTSAMVSNNIKANGYKQTYSHPEMAKQVAPSKYSMSGEKATAVNGGKSQYSSGNISSSKNIGNSKEVSSKSSYSNNYNNVNSGSKNESVSHQNSNNYSAAHTSNPAVNNNYSHSSGSANQYNSAPSQSHINSSYQQSSSPSKGFNNFSNGGSMGASHSNSMSNHSNGGGFSSGGSRSSGGFSGGSHNSGGGHGGGRH